MARLRSHLTFANVVSLLALFVALSGGAYALTLPKNSVGPKQLKRNAVTPSKIKKGAVNSSKVRDGSLLPNDFKPGQLPRGEKGEQGERGLQGLQGPPGQDATKLFAYIRDAGTVDTATVHYGSGVTAVSDAAGDSSYDVTFNRSLENCVVQAVPGSGRPAGSSSSSAFMPLIGMIFAGDPEKTRVWFYDNTTTVRDTAFLITAFC